MEGWESRRSCRAENGSEGREGEEVKGRAEGNDGWGNMAKSGGLGR